MVQNDDDSQTIMRQRPKNTATTAILLGALWSVTRQDKTKRHCNPVGTRGGDGNDWAVTAKKVLDDWII